MNCRFLIVLLVVLLVSATFVEPWGGGGRGGRGGK